MSRSAERWLSGVHDSPALLSTPDAGRYLGVASRTLELWRATGRGPRYVRINGRVKYRRAALDAFLAEREAASHADELARGLLAPGRLGQRGGRGA